jgi:hypothetical protein
MAIIRLGVANPSANVATIASTVANSHLVSVIIANKSLNASPVMKANVWVAPQGTSSADQYAYVCSNLIIGPGQSFETFRFALNANDALYVSSSTDDGSFSVYGLLQSEDVGPGDAYQTFRNKTIRGNANVLYVDKGTTAQRDNTTEVGYIRFNTDLNNNEGALEVKTTSGWKTVRWVD